MSNEHSLERKGSRGEDEPSLERKGSRGQDEPSLHAVGWRWSVYLLALGCFTFYIIHLIDHVLPPVVSEYDAMNRTNRFSGQRARASLRALTELGPRVVGTLENELLAPAVLMEELREARAARHPSQSLLFEVQKGSGAYTLESSPPFTNVYENVQNVVALLEGRGGQHSLLLNCHYDTVPTSDGASDNAITCAVMMELLRILSQAESRLQHNIVFLFNGAEESYLQGSHLFLQHPWAAKLRAFLNFDAAGSGGRAILFQTGPKNAWLFNYYARTAPHPHGQVIGEELFQSGAIPSDSDYRIFRDFRNIPGLDFAYVRNGYLYHTQYDQEKYIEPGSLQNLGNNILPLLNALGNAPELEYSRDKADDQVIFFDYLGWFMVRYPLEAGVAINVLVFLLSVASLLVLAGRLAHWKRLPQSWGYFGKMGRSIERWRLKVFPCCRSQNHKHENSKGSSQIYQMNQGAVWLELGYSLGARLGGMAVGVAFAILMGLFIDGVAPLAMPWFSNVWLLFPHYWCPCFVGCGLVPLLVDNWRRKRHGLPVSTVTQLNLVVAQVPWALLLLALTCAGVRSAVAFMVPVLFAALANLIVLLTPLCLSAHKWVWVYLAVNVPAVLFQMYLVLLFYMIILPTMGRSGVSNSDLQLALVSAALALYLGSFAIPLLSLLRRPGVVLALLATFSLVMLPISLCTSVGHPYRGPAGDPAPQRYWIMHSERLFHGDEGGPPRRQESGYLVMNLDRNSPRSLPLQGRAMSSLERDCQEELYCGVPLFEAKSVSWSLKSSWIPAAPPHFSSPTVLTRQERSCQAQPPQCTVSLTVQSPVRLTLTLAPREGVQLAEWSLPTEPRPSAQWKGRPTYFLHVVKGDPTQDYNIALTFNVTDLSGPVVDLGVAGNYIHHEEWRTEDYQSLLDSLPEWTICWGWISSYTAYVF